MQHRKPHPVSKPVQLGLFPGRICPLEVKPATKRQTADKRSLRRDGVQGGGTRRRNTEITGEVLFDLPEMSKCPGSREAYKGKPRNRRTDVVQGVGSGHSTDERRDNRREGRAATSTMCLKQGKAAGLPPRGKAQPRQKTGRRKTPKRMGIARKLQRTLYRVAKSQPERRFTLLYDKVCRLDILSEAWCRVKANKGASGIDKVDIEAIRETGEEQFLEEIRKELVFRKYRASKVLRVYIPKPGQPGRTRPLGIPTIKDRVVQMATKIVIEPLFDADFLPCSYGFRPKRTQRMALSAIARNINSGYHNIVDVDLRSYFDSIDHEKLMDLVKRRVGDTEVLRLIRAWLKAGVMDEGKVISPVRGTPQGGVLSPLLSNIFLHEIDRQWCKSTGEAVESARLIRYADDMVLMATSTRTAIKSWDRLQSQFTGLSLTVNEEKSRVTTIKAGFRFLGFEFRIKRGILYMWPGAKAVKHIGERVREVTRSIPSNKCLTVVIRKLNPVLIGWCTYFRVGNSNRVFHKVDWQVRSEIQLWLRRKCHTTWRKAMKSWNYNVLHNSYRLYRMVGKVTCLEGLCRMLPE